MKSWNEILLNGFMTSIFFSICLMPLWGTAPFIC